MSWQKLVSNLNDEQDDDKEVSIESKNTPLKRFGPGLATRMFKSSGDFAINMPDLLCGDWDPTNFDLWRGWVSRTWCAVTCTTPKKQKLSIRRSDEIGFSNEMVGGIKMSMKNGTFNTYFRVDSWDRQGEEAFVGGKDIVVFRGRWGESGWVCCIPFPPFIGICACAGGPFWAEYNLEGSGYVGTPSNIIVFAPFRRGP